MMRQVPPRGNTAAILAVLLLAAAWPVLVYGSVGYSWDSSGYYRGGRVAVQSVTGGPAVAHVAAAARAPAAAATTGTTPAPAAKPGGVGGLRSIAYSVAAYLLSMPGVSLAPLVAVQIAMLVGLLAILLEVRRRRVGAAEMATVAAGLGIASTLPVYATLATPDVFAGALITALAGLVVAAGRGTAARLWLAAVVVAAIVAHQSHVALALVALMVAAGDALVALARRRAREAMRRWRLPVAAIGVGLALNMASSLVGFGEVSVTPKHYPFALARSIEDGPARWYLARTCPTRRYVVCDLFPRGVPASNYEFLWGRDGIAARATPAQMDRLRTEEPAIVAAALRAYPWYQLKASLGNFWRQVSMIGVDPAIYQSTRLDAAGEATYRLAATDAPWLVVLQRVGLALALAWLAWAGRRAATIERGGIALVLLLVIANDAICGVISAPDIRYQNRVLWVIVLMALRLTWVSRIGPTRQSGS